VMPSSRYDAQRGSENDIDAELVREEVDRILGSSIFAQSDRLARFLRFTVDHVLADRSATLKEYLIGTEVYDRKPPYHPSVDSIVRSEARRLRNKLRQYYESAGKGDPVFIYYRTGSYAPAFRLRPIGERMEGAANRSLDELLAEGLISQAIDVNAFDKSMDVQIIFEGTIRILCSKPDTATPGSLFIKKTIFGRKSTHAGISVLPTKPSDIPPIRKVRAER
jgi:hypothetical protein